jgi:hypothetical protein
VTNTSPAQSNGINITSNATSGIVKIAGNQLVGRLQDPGAPAFLDTGVRAVVSANVLIEGNQVLAFHIGILTGGNATVSQNVVTLAQTGI